MTHYFVVGTIVVLILIFQFYYFLDSLRKISLFKNIFPAKTDSFQLKYDEESNNLSGIDTNHTNKTFKIILNSLNNYLKNNKGAVSDFHLMKDIIDRNCDAKEEEISTQTPVPLYFGLVGTMLGILIGVGFLVAEGGINQLINPTSDSLGNSSASDGIEVLLGAVALAMIASVIGILFTIIGSINAKIGKSKIEENKNIFLSWIQAKLLPNISNDTSAALVRMTDNLSSFNKTFSKNSKQLNTTLNKINQSYSTHERLLNSIKELNIENIATANIEVYKKLKDSTKHLSVFGEYLNKSNDYLSHVEKLSTKLDNYERRTQIIESAGKFYNKNEKWLADNIDTANIAVKESIERFGNASDESLTKLRESISGQILDFNKVIIEQQELLKKNLKSTSEEASNLFLESKKLMETTMKEQEVVLEAKMKEITFLFDELKSLSHIKKGIQDFKESTDQQNRKIDLLTKEISSLAKMKVQESSTALTSEPSFVSNPTIKIPKTIKVVIITTCGMILFSCLVYIIPTITSWIKNI